MGKKQDSAAIPARKHRTPDYWRDGVAERSTGPPIMECYDVEWDD